MNNKLFSPRIKKLSWARVEVEGISTPFKDVVLFPGGAREWDWRKTGTRHSPGIQPGDVEELLARGAKIVILSQGVYKRLRVCPETRALLEQNHVPFHVLPTKKAVALYNELCEEQSVGALIHSTC